LAVSFAHRGGKDGTDLVRQWRQKKGAGHEDRARLCAGLLG